MIENEKFFFHHVVHEKVGRGIEFEPLPVITSIQNGGSKLTPDATFWREAPRVVVAKNKFDIWNRLDLRIKNIYTFIPFCKIKKIKWEMTEYFDFGLPDLVLVSFMGAIIYFCFASGDSPLKLSNIFFVRC